MEILPTFFTHTALPSINNVHGESLITLILGNIVLLSELHPVWDWDQNLRATDFPSFRMVERASVLELRLSHLFCSLLSRHGRSAAGQPGEAGVFEHASSLPCHRHTL